MAEIVLSGIRPTGELHLGNFLGAVENFVKLQAASDNTCFFFVADQHSLTDTLKNTGLADQLRGNLLEIVKDYLAAGLDLGRSTIYVQSSVPEITELAFYLGCLQPVGELLTIPTYKEKARQDPNAVNHGLLTYPVLMAADILGPKSTLVPVGADQVPHVELARDLAKAFNSRFGETFPVPAMIRNMVLVPGLDGEKMGKSDANNAIGIHLPIAEIRRLYLERGVTDKKRELRTDPGHPSDCKSVYPLHRLLAPAEQLAEITQNCQSAQIGCVECKHLLVDTLAKLLEPFQAKRAELAGKDELVREILHEGGKRARAIIAKTVAEVRDKMGIVIY